MRYVCSQCGKEIPEDSDFCYYCGALKEKAYAFDADGTADRYCHKCGHPIAPGESFCPECHTPIPRPVPMEMNKLAMPAVLLALIPGFFNIFGLGHLLMKQYARGGMFLIMSGILWWIYPGWSSAPSMAILFLRVGIFAYQLFDLYRFIYTPRGQRWIGPRSTGPRTWTAF